MKAALAFFQDIKLSHTLFALPFALGVYLMSSQGWGEGRTFLLILACMFCARTSAMGFNRWLDADLDGHNPRTAQRAIPSGRLRSIDALIASLLSGALFLMAAAYLNPLCQVLAPLVLLVLWFYSFCKRFTAHAHYVLGLSLAIAPAGAAIAVQGTLDPNLIWLSAAVLLWTAGFDIIYACQDHDFDKEQALHSIPVKWGIARALKIAASLHALMLVCLAAFIVFADGHHFFWLAFGVIAVLLWRQHKMVSPDDLSQANQAFFNMNVWVSMIVMVALANEGFQWAP